MWQTIPRQPKPCRECEERPVVDVVFSGTLFGVTAITEHVRGFCSPCGEAFAAKMNQYDTDRLEADRVARERRQKMSER